jgi:hypothetical protein
MKAIRLPGITRVCSPTFSEALDKTPLYLFTEAIPFYYSRNGRFVRELI